ncbi:MAG: nucleotidyl transferase AbiEii/AbiGii toxin family protein [Acidobacteria bacterium]|nr:nucleotidyl transferase AbiEii/AbiGii toxin family protein [Acidobacteriota bacterium]
MIFSLEAMTERQFYDWQTSGGGGEVLLLIETLEHAEIPWCVIGGLAVNYWAEESIATADVDLAIAGDELEQAIGLLEAAGFRSSRHAYTVNLKGRSAISVQISTEPVYLDFPSRSVPADVHGILMRVSCLEDTIQGKILAWRDSERRSSKRQKDFLDIMRLVESHPHLADSLPEDVLAALQNAN